MTTEEQLWDRFKEVETVLFHLRSIVQNPLEEVQLTQEEIDEWREEGYAICSKLSLLILETYTFLEKNNAKDI
jgi:hypothetical protein